MTNNEKTLPIYKINHLINQDTIDTIYVFYGYFPSDKDLNQLFKDEPNNELFYPEIFNDEELTNIKNNNISVVFLSQKIHFDDSIGTIKIKIADELSKKSKKIFALEEMYLFCMKEETLNAVSIYETLTQNKRFGLTKTRLYNFLLNIIRDSEGNSVTIQIPESMNNKSIFDFDDIISLNIDGKTFYMNKAIGQKYYVINNEYPYVYNPFDNRNRDDFIEQTKRALTTSNSELLLNTGSIINNNIYLCLVSDVLNQVDAGANNVDYIIKVYYPFLFSNDIFSLTDLDKERENLIEQNKKVNNPVVIESFNITNLFYDVYNERKSELKYDKKGITHIRAVMHPSYSTHIPIDVIFKLLHATKDVPLVKYNPASRQENMYRLYADKLSTDGRKIPYLNKATILKLVKSLGRDKMVSLYIEDDSYTITCEFESNGIISIVGNFNSTMTLDGINTLFKNSINPIINNLNDYLLQNGYKINLFESLDADNIEISNLKYETIIEIDKNINISELTNCISSIFVVESSDVVNDIQLRFKKVANFNKVTSQEAFIIEKQKERLRGGEIIDAFLQSYPDMSRDDAINLFEKIVSEAELQRTAKRKTVTIRNNPGFKTNIHLNKEKSQITITMDNINNINYLDTVPIYLDTMVRLTQNKSSTGISLEKINQLCFNSKTIAKELEILNIDLDDIISASESSLIENDMNKEIDKLEMEDIEKEETKSQMGDGDDENYGVENIESENDQIEAKEKIANVLNIFYGDYDDEEEEESEEQEEAEKVGGGDRAGALAENNVKDIVGMKLSNPFLFQERLEKREPILILKEEQGKYNRYSRTCPSTTRRQPVILTQSELDKINKENDGYLQEEDVIKYGSNPDNKYYYVCPRYWNLKTDSLITPKEIEDNHLEDKIIPKTAKTVPKGKYIYEFYNPPKNNPDYKHFPGFQVDKHPDGYCLPCCFNSWSTPKQLERRKLCSENVIPGSSNQPVKSQILREDEVVGLNEGEEDSESQKQPGEPQRQKKEKAPELENYVIGPEKFPISKGRWGYLPTAIQKILMEVNYNCQISKNNTNIKPDHTCLVRHGIESDINQSFIACIADAIFFTKLDENKQPMQIPSIKKMKEIIIESLTIDSFITFQNGDLVNTFMVDTTGVGAETEIDMNSTKIEKYNSSNLYKKTVRTGSENDTKDFFNKVVNSFENFIEFLRNNDTVIDYTYLWDIVCRPNPLLFNSGINLVILEIPNNDITNNVDFICPTNHYSTHLFDGKKPTLVLIKQESFFEPIYSYRFNKSSETLFIGKLFSEYDTKLSVTMRDFFKKVVKPYIQNMCLPIPSIPNLYKMAQPILLDELLNNLDKIKYDVLQQVVNYQNKVIGLVVVKGGKGKVQDRGNGFIPCFPSSINEKYDYQFMTDKNIWNTYSNTLYCLVDVYKESKGKIPCNPVLKIVEDEMIVGFLTQTNQVVQLSEPVSIESEVIKDDLPLLKDHHYVVNNVSDDSGDSDGSIKLENVDVSIALSNRVDTERVEYIKKIKMEYEFYQVFRTTIRILLNDYENIKLRESIENEIKKNYVMYYSKIEIIKKLLKELVERKNTVIFTDNYNYDMIKEITTCVTRSTGSGEKSKCSMKSPVCVVSDNGDTCQLILPKKNLVTGKNNELIYYEKMSDELIRYIRINKYIFEPKSYLSFENMGYNLNDNEILLFQSLITQEYFEGLIPAIQNKYVKHNTYDSVEPILTEYYDNTVKYDPNTLVKSGPSKLVIHVPTVGPLGSVTIPIEVPKRAEPFASTPLLACKSVINDKISSGIWKKCFPNGCGEKEYDKTVECTFQVLLDIGINLSINSIRKQLYDEYKKYLPTYEGQILDILMGQGKKSLVARVKSKLITFHDLLFSESYYLTTLDYWILLTKFRISSFFISSKYLFDTKYTSNNMLIFDDDASQDTFAFIVIPGIVNDIVPAYKLIVNKKESNTAFISLKEFNDCEGRNELMVTIDEKETTGIIDHLEQYIKNFTRTKTTVYKKKQPKLVMDETPEQSGQNEETRLDKEENISASSSKSIEVTAPKNVNALRKKANGTKKNVAKKIVNRRQHTEKKTGAVAKKPLLIIAEEQVI
jgi:hypothetical protein